jgi:hypothetical protein
MTAVYRAPMRARDLDLPPGRGAEHGLARDLVGIGGDASRGEKGARLLHRFALVPEGSFVWTRATDGRYHLGRIRGPWRYDASPDARATGIVHVRPATWLDRSFDESGVPAAVAATFARGGRNFQRTRDEAAERETERLWQRWA